jgi:hypothetical protein
MRFIFYFDILSYIGYTMKSRLIQNEGICQNPRHNPIGGMVEIQFS